MRQLRVNVSDSVMSQLDRLVENADHLDRTFFVREALNEYLGKHAAQPVQSVQEPAETEEEPSEDDADFQEAMRQVVALRAEEKRVLAEKAEVNKMASEFLDMPNMVL